MYKVREKPQLQGIKVLCVSGVINEDEIDGLLKAERGRVPAKASFNIATLLGKIVELLEMENHGLERKLGA